MLRTSTTANFRFVAQLGLATAALMFGLIVLGSIVRTTGSGLACPDWPLCHGKLIPPLQFNVLVEWFHRLVALLVSAMLAVVVGTVFARRPLRRRLGWLAGFSVAALVLQILLGAFTVWKLLAPAFVSAHLAVALLLFSVLLVLTLRAGREADGPAGAPGPHPPGLAPLLGVAAALVYAQAVLGGAVSSSGASLACRDWPTCNGQWFPPLEGLVGLQMAHRWGAYLLTAYLGFVAWRARAAADPLLASGGGMLLALTLGQIALGVCNIFLGIQVWLSALHLANAAGMLALAIAMTFRALSLRAPSARPAPEAAS